MKTVHIKASREYDVIIDRGIIDRVGAELRKISKAKKAVVVSGETVFPIYGERVIKSLESEGFEVLRFIHKTGEGAKSVAVYGELLNFLASNHVSASDMLVALGGGVTGDLTGFAAATFLRGMEFIQVPTTLLAAVDSSVGGKTAINLDAGKNLAGCFYQPSAVLCDPDTLETLSPADYRCGCAEVIKYGVLGNYEFFTELENTPIPEQVEHVIEVSVSMKRDVVENDEFDKGLRRLLNLGHSFGHAVEKCSNFEIHHGDAVSIGMAAIMRASCSKGICTAESRDRVISLLRRNGLPTETEYSLDELYAASTSDKKIASGKMHLVVPEEIGKCRIVPMPVAEMRDWMAAGEIK